MHDSVRRGETRDVADDGGSDAGDLALGYVVSGRQKRCLMGGLKVRYARGAALGIEIVVHGKPAPQGSKRFVGHARSGKGILIESSRYVKPWREAVMWTVKSCRLAGPMSGPVGVSMTFYMPRPKAAKKGSLPATRPDLSKLVRSTEDALVDAGVLRDDAQIVKLAAEKRYVGGEFASPGAVIRIESIEKMPSPVDARTQD